MVFNTRYDIGDKVWVLLKQNGAVNVFDAEIDYVGFDRGGVEYIIKETCDSYKEENVVKMGDSVSLERRIKEMMEEIREEEKRANEE